jgi:hypothetical protein
LKAATAFQSATNTAFSTGIQALDPSTGRPGDFVKIRGSGFGTSKPQNMEVYFPSRSGDCIPVKIVSLSDATIEVEVPDGIGTGCVGFVQYGADSATTAQAASEAVAEAAFCLGPAVGESIRSIYDRVLNGALKPPCPPSLKNNPNQFVGGAPVIRTFVARRVRGTDSISGTNLDLQPGDSLTLSWQIDHANTVTIAPIALNGLLNELPSLAAPFDPRQGDRQVKWNGSVQAAGAYDWIGQYQLTASNLGGATTAIIRLCMHIPKPLSTNPFFWGVADAGRQVEGNLTNDDWEILTSDPQILSRKHMAHTCIPT